MDPHSPSSSEMSLEEAETKNTGKKFRLRLFVAGNNPNGRMAILNLQEICQKYIPDDYSMEVIDIYQQAALAREEQIIATPTLIKELPLPRQRFIGDLSRTDLLKNALGL
jgi:circadian clock protein KaiB